MRFSIIRLILIIASLLLQYSIICQSEEGSHRIIHGLFDGAFPVVLEYNQDSGDCTGSVAFDENYGSSILEGECTDSTFLLFEFDKFSRVKGVIRGEKVNDDLTMSWSNYNHSLTYHILPIEDPEGLQHVRVYKEKDEAQRAQIVLCPGEKRINYQSEETINLTWTHYLCPGSSFACTYESPSGKAEHISVSGITVSTDNRVLYPLDEFDVITKTSIKEESFFSFRFPEIDDKEFDQFIKSVIAERLSKFEKKIIAEGPDSEDLLNRFKYKAVGDFFISISSKELISGYLTYYSSFRPRLETIPFSYNRSKNTFYSIKDLWKKEFNYTFYLKSLIENEKRDLLLREPSYVKRTLKDVPFSHFNIVPSGIAFFTDYNFVFGRKHIIAPFDDIEGFINDKAIKSIF